MAHEHLTRREIEAWRNEGAGDRARIASQIAGCPTCREVAAEVERAQPPPSAPSRFDPADFRAAGHRAFPPQRPAWGAAWGRRWALAAAAAILIVAVTPVVLQRLAPPESDVLRGGGLTLLAPAGEVASVDEFRWVAGFSADTYLLEVLEARDTVIFSAITRDMRLPVDADLRARLTPGSYRWRVTARDPAGDAMQRSPPAEFRVVR